MRTRQEIQQIIKEVQESLDARRRATGIALHVPPEGLAEPLSGTVELAGPEPIRQDDLVRRFLNAA